MCLSRRERVHSTEERRLIPGAIREVTTCERWQALRRSELYELKTFSGATLARLTRSRKASVTAT
jgi:hypothetical protein